MVFDYFDEFPSAITICDIDCKIVYMNKKSVKTFEKWGGNNLIGKSLYDCHTEKSINKINEILKTGISNSYTIEKEGLKKLIHQSAWFKEGKIAGLIEISIILPNEIQHFIR